MMGIERVFWIAYGVMWSSIAFAVACLIVAAFCAYRWRRARKEIRTIIKLLNVKQSEGGE